MWPGLTLARCQLVTTATTTRASRVTAGSFLLTCRRHYPGRFDGTYSLVLFHQRRPSPKTPWVGSCINRYGLHARPVAYATLYTGGSDGFVSFTAAPIASTGWSDPVPGRDFHPQ